MDSEKEPNKYPEEYQDGQSDQQGDVALEEGRPKLKEPPRYAVLIHNDHYTTMEFVVQVLKRYFYKSGDQAQQIMLSVHNKGKGVAGYFSLQIAETKVVQVHDHARSHGFPLLCSVEPTSET
jgi:ATP-dependent Clp protease adaptor protein ClpS